MKIGGTLDEYQYGYTEQLSYLNSKIEDMVDEIIQQSDETPIIIIQGDHGPGSEVDFDSLENTNVKERHSIFNAILLPDNDISETLPEDMSPVNTFRFILNNYFGSTLPLHNDRAYYSTYEYPYRYTDVTSEVRYE